MNKKISFLALLGLLNLIPAAHGQYFYIVEKQEGYIQSGNATSADNPAFRFQVQIGNSGNTTQDSNTPPPPNEFSIPGNATPISLVAPTGIGSDDQWKYRSDFADMSSMNTAFPDGNYTLTIGGNTGNIDLSGDLYTNIPQASFNSVAGNWSGNIFNIYRGQTLVINTNSIAGFIAGNFRVGIEADPSGGFGGSPPNSIQFDSFDNGLIDSSGNITIPAAYLAEGNSWDIQLEFNAFSTIDQVSFPGNTAVGIYTVKTSFQVSAIPEPAETVLTIGALSLGFALWRRRRTVA